MGGEFDRKLPVFFQKRFDAVTFEPNVRYPTHTDNLHHEMELVVVVGKNRVNLSLRGGAPKRLSLVTQWDLTSPVVIVNWSLKKKAVHGNLRRILTTSVL